MIYAVLKASDCASLVAAIHSEVWNAGKARTAELTGTVKKNREILSHPVLESIGKRLLAHPEIQQDHLPYKAHRPKFSRYDAGDRYRRHTDAPWMQSTRTDLSCTIWLNDDYGGGELVIGGLAYKGKAGEAIVYNCGESHEVLPVTSGSRFCVITWIQSRIRDPEKRRLVAEYRRFLGRLEGDYDLFTEGAKFHSALLRRWSET